ncbi:MAG: insulinase family protein, partial [Pyrinomonadaceae bacterium]|nr:insulinase family protein [Pyrinomonadaceae bacterium]
MKQTPAIIRLFLVAAFAVSILTPSFAQTAATATNSVIELDVNGMKVLIKRRPGTPTVAAGLFFRGGSRNLTAANAGIESFALAVAGEATKSYPRQSLRKEIARMGTNISSGSNNDYSALSLASTKTNFETSWKIFTDVALNPAFATEDVERLRDARLTALRAVNDSPESMLAELNDKIIYAGHPYANSPEGTIETVSKFKTADLVAYHKGLLETSRMLLVVVGDVEPQALQKDIEKAFGTLPKGSYKAEPVVPLTLTKSTLDVTSKSLQTDYVKGTFAAPSLRDPDYYAMRTAITILQQNVFQEVRVRRNLSYAPDADLSAMGANTGSISVSSVNPNEAVRAMLGEIQKLQQGSADQ